MKKNYFVTSLVLLAVTLAVVFTSCSTTVTAEVTRPAHLDIETIQSISVLPFRTSREMGAYYGNYKGTPVVSFEDFMRQMLDYYRAQNDEVDIVRELDAQLRNKLAKKTDFHFIDSIEVERAIDRNYEIPVDVYITGGITEYSTQIKSEDVKRKDKEGKEYIVTQFWKEVNISFLYQVVNAKTYRIISTDEYSYNLKSSKETKKEKIPDNFDLVESEIPDFVDRIMRDFAPYSVSKSYTLLKHKDDDMKAAAKVADKGQILTAAKQYLMLYKTRGYFEAGYNSALLLQANGKYEEALDLMTQVYNDTGDKRAKDAMNDIKNEINSAARLERQLSK